MLLYESVLQTSHGRSCGRGLLNHNGVSFICFKQYIFTRAWMTVLYFITFPKKWIDLWYDKKMNPKKIYIFSMVRSPSKTGLMHLDMTWAPDTKANYNILYISWIYIQCFIISTYYIHAIHLPIYISRVTSLALAQSLIVLVQVK